VSAEVDQIVQRRDQAGLRGGLELGHVEADEVRPLATTHLGQHRLAERGVGNRRRLDSDLVLARVELLEPLLQLRAAARVAEGRGGEGERGDAAVRGRARVGVRAASRSEGGGKTDGGGRGYCGAANARFPHRVLL